MRRSDTIITDEAMGWLVRVNDPAFADWDAWEAWIVADPRHADAYWSLASAEQDAVDALGRAAIPERAPPVPEPREPRRQAPVRRRGVSRPWIAMAAGIVVVAGVSLIVWSRTPQPWTIETSTGEVRTVQLADGSTVSLDGATRLTLDRRRPRDVDLEAGRALFDVVHDDARPFRVEVNGAVLTDLGTVFDVTRLTDGVRVSVSEGRVQVEAPTGSAVLDAGDGALVTAAGVERRAISIPGVSDWRDGRLTYAGERLGVVAEDLSRLLGRPIILAPGLGDRRFTGSVLVADDPENLRLRLGVLMDVSIVETGDGWRLEPRSAP